MAYFAAVRSATGQIYSLQDSPQAPSNLTERAASAGGGSADDYQLVHLSQAQFTAALESFSDNKVFLNGDTITIQRGFSPALAAQQADQRQGRFVLRSRKIKPITVLDRKVNKSWL